MPQKEHLTFESKTPAFLRRLRGETSSNPSDSSSDPDRHTVPQVRARKPRDPADLDDGPVYIDGETGQMLAQGEFDEMKKVTESSNGIAKEQTPTAPDEETKDVEMRKVASKATVHVGAIRRKREIPLVIGDDPENAEPSEQGEHVKEAGGIKGVGRKAMTATSKVGKKVKKIKLSFDDEDGQ